MDSKTLLLREFVKFVARELQLQSLPASIKFVGNDYSKEHLTFGTYNTETDEIVVVMGNRHIADVLRTLAHELVHHKQREEGKPSDGRDGSPIENEANAKAGEFMRKFRTVNPEMYSWSNEMSVKKKVNEMGYVPVTDTPPASTDMTPTVSNDPHLVSFDEDYSVKQNKILSIVKDKKPAEIDGTLIDIYTAALLTKVLHKLSPENRKKLLTLPADKMVAASYKLVTR